MVRLVALPAMVLPFTKMNGAGNDFVLIDNRSERIILTPKQVVRLCHRQRGIGADGLLLLIPCHSGKADWAWTFYNSDGGRAEMCGNGARCFARFVQRLTGVQDSISFETDAGLIRANFEGERVTVNLTDPRDLRLAEKVTLAQGDETIHFVNTGVPHAIVFVTSLDKTPVHALGSEIRYHPHYAPRGTNANFVQLLGPQAIRVRTYERGVEGETLACGTGVTAAALITARVHGFASPVSVQVQGGDLLQVGFSRDRDAFRNVLLTGPAEFVFDGSIGV